MKKIHRFIGKFDLSSEQGTITDEKIVKQIFLVLKLKIGEEIKLSDGHGNEVLVQIVKINKNVVNFKLISRSKNQEKKNHSILYCAVLKKENFEFVVQKATEVGIDKIVPIITRHTVKLGLKMNRLQKIAQEASEQCGRSTMPIVAYPVEFHEALQLAEENDLNLFFDMDGDQNLVGIKDVKNISIFIGPEGGWDEEEVKFIAKNNKFKIASLGDLTLRAETAAIIASYRVSNVLLSL